MGLWSQHHVNYSQDRAFQDSYCCPWSTSDPGVWLLWCPCPYNCFFVRALVLLQCSGLSPAVFPFRFFLANSSLLASLLELIFFEIVLLVRCIYHTLLASSFVQDQVSASSCEAEYFSDSSAVNDLEYVGLFFSDLLFFPMMPNLLCRTDCWYVDHAAWFWPFR